MSEESTARLAEIVEAIGTLADSARVNMDEVARVQERIDLLNGEIKVINAARSEMSCRIGELNTEAKAIARAELAPFERGDLLEDELGVRYRLTRYNLPFISIQPLTDSYAFKQATVCGEQPKPPTVEDYLGEHVPYGFRLNGKGVQVGGEAREIYGKLSKLVIGDE